MVMEGLVPYTSSDIQFLVHKRLDPIMKSPNKYSKAQVLNACREAVNHVDRAC